MVIINMQDKIFISLNHSYYENINKIRTLGHGVDEPYFL
jgi:hypothetical protein